jgi:Ca2+/Na+ antiporter
MRNLFLVVGKLVGIIAVVQALVFIPYIAVAVSTLTGTPQEESRTEPLFMLAGIIVGILLYLGLAGLLLFKTEKLADVLRVSKVNEDFPVGQPEQLLRVGLVLIGTYVLITAIPELLSSLIQVSRGGGSFAVGNLVSSILRVLVAIYVTLFSRRVIKAINNYER